MIILGHRIKERRRTLSVTQEQLASELGVSRTAVAKWESGEKEPTLQNLTKLCKILGCSSDYLLGIEESPAAAHLSDRAREALNSFIRELSG